MNKMSKKIASLISIVLCAALVVTNVHAYPVQDSEYKVTTTPAAENETLSSAETVVWDSQQPKNWHGYSPAICIADNDRVIVTYDISTIRSEIVFSDDGGETFQPATLPRLAGSNDADDDFIFARPFKTTSGLYIVARRVDGTEDEPGPAYGNLIMYKSTDNGSTWETASTIATGRWHSAPTEIVAVKENDVDYVYMTWDMQNMVETDNLGGAGRGVLAPIVMKARADADLTLPESWTYSDGVQAVEYDGEGKAVLTDLTSKDYNPMCYYDAIGGTNNTDGNTWDKVDYMGVPFHHYRYATNNNGNIVNRLREFGWLEGNIVRITDESNELYDPAAVCHIYLRSSAGTSDYANIMKVVEDEEGNMVSELVTTPSGKTLLYVQLPGGQSKFYITYDETSKKYWMVSNVSADSMKEDTTAGAGANVSKHEGPQDIRNELGLFYSSNAMDWDFAGYVSRTEDVNQARSYASMVIDGNDLLIVSRSGDANAESAHNNNQIIFHRISDFRSLAEQQSIANGGATSVKASNGTAYYDSNILEDDSVADINTYITKLDTTVVTCSVSDEEQTTSKVLVKNADGFYAETLTTSYKLGEPFEANDMLYVFGVSDEALVAFQSKDEGMTWDGPYVLDDTHHWNEAPTSAIVKDDSIMLALSEIKEESYWRIRGYNDADACTYDEDSKMWTLTGNGAMGYTEAFDLEEGDSIAFDIEPQALVNGYNHEFGLAFLDKPTFWGNAADYGEGFVVDVRTTTSYETDNILQFYSSHLRKNGDKYETPNLVANFSIDSRIGKKNIVSSSEKKSIEVKFMKRTQTIDEVDCAWSIFVTYTKTDGTLETVSMNLPVSEVPADKFSSGLYFAAGGRTTSGVEYKISNVRVEENIWDIYSRNSNYTNEVEQDGVHTTLSGRTAVYSEDKIAVHEGTKISMDVQVPTVVSGQNVQYAFGLTTGSNSFHNADGTATATTLVTELTSPETADVMTAGGAIRLPGGGREHSVPAAVTLTEGRGNISATTYNITFEKQAETSEYSWVMTAKEDKADGNVVTMNVPKEKISHLAFADGVYLVAGSMNGVANVMKVSNVTVTQPDGKVSYIATVPNTRNTIAPVVMTASLSSDLTDEDSWTYSEGTSFVEKIGNVYTNTRFNYFGLPYTKADVRDIGWSDLKLFEIHNSDDIRYDEASGNVYGYMTLENAGYNYAAFVKVNAETNGIEFFTPPALTEGVKEEEMVFSKLPGGNNGFEILYDEFFDRYWLVTTVNTDTTNTTDNSASRIVLYYSTNAYDWIYAGTVASNLSGDAKVSAAINDDDLFVTATNTSGVVSYTIPAFRDLVKTDRWSLIRGYNETAGTGTMTSGENKVTLAGYGGAVCDTKILAQSDTEISFVLKPTSLPENAWFSVGLIDTKGSFFGEQTLDTGNGFQITIKPWSDANHGAQVLYNYVVDGASINPVEGQTTLDKDGNIVDVYPFVGGAQIPDRLVESEKGMEFKFVKLSNENWCVYFEVEINGVTYDRCQELKYTEDTKKDIELFKDGAYLIAGGSNGKTSTCEISNLKVRQPVLGDVNDDGEVNALDFVATDFRYRRDVEERNVYTAYEKHLYDIDKSWKCDVEDVKLLRSMVLGNKNTTQAVSLDTDKPEKVRLERWHYKANGVDMTDVTIRTTFTCGGLEGLFLYDNTQLTYENITCETSQVSGVTRNEPIRTVSIDEKGMMITALGKVKEGTKGNIVTLTFKGIWKEDFNMSKDIFANVEGTKHENVKFYDVMLGDSDEDYEVDICDLVRMVKDEGKTCTDEGQYMNSDCNRDDNVSRQDTNLLMDYLCEILLNFKNVE